MKLYQINLHKLGVYLLPVMMRAASIVEFYRIILKPSEPTLRAFIANGERNIYTLTHNGQVCKLRAVLNDAFPGTSKPFAIEDHQDSGQWQFIWDDTELYKQLMIPEAPNAIIIWNETTMSKFADFKVSIPIELQGVDNMNKIRAIVNTYKLVSKKAVYEYY